MPIDVRKLRNSKTYRKRRNAFLARFPLCRECRKKGLQVLAVELDHIVPVAKKPEWFWNEENWQGLCRPCHELKTSTENVGDQASEDWVRRMAEWETQ